MRKNKTSATIYLDEPCGRCGSKRRVAKKWKEVIPTIMGTTTIDYTQIVCTNIICQENFDKVQLAEKKKRNDARITKEKNLAARKAESLSKKNMQKRAHLA
ncbi:MAG: hypothetical protein ABH816_03420 [Candidatus Levyibacteriota bacterium]